MTRAARNPPIFIGSEIYRGSTYGRVHPLAIPRVPTVIDLSRTLGWLPDSQYRNSPRAKAKALTAFHTERYVSALQDAERSQTVSPDIRDRHGLGTLSNPVFPEMFRRPATAVGGSMLGAELVAQGHVVFSPGGGTHHGFPDRAAGFCYFNDPVIAVLTLLANGMARVAYVDIDAHHCDGVEAAFHGRDDVLLISVHEVNRWPFTGAASDTASGSAINLPVPRDFNDTEFRLLFDTVIVPALQSYRPDAIVLQCGADAVTEDPLSRLALSNNSHFKTVAALKAMCPRLLVLGGGGYNPWSVARLWSGVWATLNGHTIPAELPSNASSVLRALTWNRQAGRNPPEHWHTTIRDDPRDGEIRDEIQILAKKKRFKSMI
ncbi:MAG: acetoin utilization protein AcuC [Pseudomonadota bacterium]